MNKNKVIQKIAILGLWLLVGSGMIALLAAANHKQMNHTCKEIVVTIKGSGEKYYVEKSDILAQLKEAISGGLIGKSITTLNLSKLEKALLKNAWIREAQLYFDSRNVLHVIVMEREPIARIFTTGGSSFYLDSAGTRMPLLDKVSIRLPVVTNFPVAKKWSVRDSVLVKGLVHLVQYVNRDHFWQAQIAQIDIQPDARIELIPVVGNHIIRIGTVENIAQKLHNLLLFYQQVARRAGFDLYKVVDVQYAGQVIGMKTVPTAAIDSIQLQQNIAALIERTKAQALNDSLFTEKVQQMLLEKEVRMRKLDSVIAVSPAEGKTPPAVIKPVQGKPVLSKPVVQSKPKSGKPEQQPKAVMPKKKDKE